MYRSVCVVGNIDTVGGAPAKRGWGGGRGKWEGGTESQAGRGWLRNNEHLELVALLAQARRLCHMVPQRLACLVRVLRRRDIPAQLRPRPGKHMSGTEMRCAIWHISIPTAAILTPTLTSCFMHRHRSNGLGRQIGLCECTCAALLCIFVLVWQTGYQLGGVQKEGRGGGGGQPSDVKRRCMPGCHAMPGH